ncbi:MAG: hypothetical protein RJA22_566 [Verrucomicrobiota bacterium]|jgi:hypothetical protein
MKALISILVVLVLVMGGMKLYEYWEKVSREEELKERAADGSDIKPEELRGVEWDAEEYHRKALQEGPEAVKRFLDRFDKSPKFKDPRRAWIELDYIVSITRTDPVEARQRFKVVKERVRTNSVVYPRIRAMSKTYE